MNSQWHANYTKTAGWEGFYNVPAGIVEVWDCEARHICTGSQRCDRGWIVDYIEYRMEDLHEHEIN